MKTILLYKQANCGLQRYLVKIRTIIYLFMFAFQCYFSDARIHHTVIVVQSKVCFFLFAQFTLNRFGELCYTINRLIDPNRDSISIL